MAHLAVADKLIIHIEKQAGVHPLKVEQVALIGIRLEMNGAMIEPTRSILRYKWWIKWERVVDIGVVMMVEAVVLPV